MDGGILSQDEINALLSGMDLSGDNSASDSSASESTSSGSNEVDQNLLSDIEKDAIGEVANISMGTSATTLYSLVNQKVNITTPTVSLATMDTLMDEYEEPCVFISIKYTVGLDGSNILILRENDVKIITDLMMGGDGTNTSDELGELHLSAISEAMNQMMGSSATSLSSMLGRMIDISPPSANLVDIQEFKENTNLDDFLSGTFCKIAFRMQIGDLVDSTILQLYPLDFARSLYQIFMNNQVSDAIPDEAPASEPAPSPEPTLAQAPMPDMSANMNQNPNMMGMNPNMNMGMPDMSGMNPMMGNPMMNPMMGNPMMNPMMGMYGYPNMGNVNVQPAKFSSFEPQSTPQSAPENIGLIMDVPLEVTVELGRTKKSIADILDFAPGTIIELDKIAGEPIDVLVNGKYVAKGEVVVIEESFGIRVTEIIN